MKHLIQTINYGGIKYCVKHGATSPKWRTESILQDMDFDGIGPVLVGTEDDDQWYDSGLARPDYYGSISFATCCVSKFTVRFFRPSTLYWTYFLGSISTEDQFQIGYFVQGNPSPWGEPSEATHDIVVDLESLGLTEKPCGRGWTINYSSFGQDAGLYISIIDVEFGTPP